MYDLTKEMAQVMVVYAEDPTPTNHMKPIVANQIYSRLRKRMTADPHQAVVLYLEMDESNKRTFALQSVSISGGLTGK